jgi:ABC-2 type transport system permease protein
MKHALHAEWTKMRTITSPLWLLLGTITTTVALSAATTSLAHSGDTPRLTLTGVYLGQAPIAVLAVLTISAEYNSGTIRTTLAAMPRRTTVLAAKAVTLTAVVAAGGTTAVLGAVLAGRLILPSHGALSPSNGPTLRAAFGTVLYLILIALLSLGVATALRDSATSIGVVLGLLYIVPILSETISDPAWHRLLQKTAPMTSGLAIQATTDLESLPISPWPGLAVTATWTAAALLTGALLLHNRDT